MEKNFTELEEKIFKYFLNDFECYATGKLRSDNLKEVFSDWVEDNLESKSFFHKSINEFFYPELNVSEEDLLISIRQNDLTFKDYIIGVMKKFDLESYLMKDNILNIREAEEEVLDSQEEQSAEDIEAATKQVAIKDMLGVEDIDLSNLEPEELDNLMVKAAQDSLRQRYLP